MLHIISVLFVVSRLVTVCHSDSLPIPNALSIVSIARSSNVGINEGVNSLVNRHKSCPEGYELGRTIRTICSHELIYETISTLDKFCRCFTTVYQLNRKG